MPSALLHTVFGRTPRLLVADSTRAKYCPDSLFEVEGEAFRPTIAAFTKLLKKPIVRIWNDGELNCEMVTTHDFNSHSLTAVLGRRRR